MRVVLGAPVSFPPWANANASVSLVPSLPFPYFLVRVHAEEKVRGISFADASETLAKSLCGLLCLASLEERENQKEVRYDLNVWYSARPCAG